MHGAELADYEHHAFVLSGSTDCTAFHEPLADAATLRATAASAAAPWR